MLLSTIANVFTGRAPIPMAASPLITPSSSGDSRQFGGRHTGFPQRQNQTALTQQLDESGGNGNPGTAGQTPRRRRWYLGIQSKKEPAHVMSEVYKALHVLHFEWKVVAPYRVKCRWQPGGFNLNEHSHDSGKFQSQIKIGLQLYKV
jgi:5'-AMP-activated protein kinase catalytic alpha subunit